MNEIFQELQQIYAELAIEISQLERKPKCYDCGACCNFNYFDHTPFITELELQNIRAGLLSNPEISMLLSIQQDENLCPFFINQTCKAHELRPLSCRVYFCNIDYENNVANEIYEKYHRKIKLLHEKSGISYLYLPFVRVLRNLNF